MKTWKPDTCECEVEEIYQGTEIKGMGRVIHKGPEHINVPDDELYGVLYSNSDGENKRKNQMLRILLGFESVKGLGLEEIKKNQDGSDAGLGLKQGIEYDWSFTGIGKDRILRVEVRGGNLSIPQKNAIRALSNTKFGINKVEIV